jgi:hypothetical protein
MFCAKHRQDRLPDESSSPASQVPTQSRIFPANGWFVFTTKLNCSGISRMKWISAAQCRHILHSAHELRTRNQQRHSPIRSSPPSCTEKFFSTRSSTNFFNDFLLRLHSTSTPRAHPFWISLSTVSESTRTKRVFSNLPSNMFTKCASNGESITITS